MTSLPRITPGRRITIQLEPLSPSSFAHFGTVIHSSLSSDLRSIPSTLPPTAQENGQTRTLPQPQFANQKTALKTSPISPLTNNYPAPTKSQAQSKNAEAKGLMSMFSCFPRNNLYLDQEGKLRLKLEILERHPFTSQTFCPLNFSSSRATGADKTANTTMTVGGRTFFIVVVAPSLKTQKDGVKNVPDLTRIRAFLAPLVVDDDVNGIGMAVTYNPGTWHAPMVVVGERRVDFLVTQFVNGVADDDCQEVLVGSNDEHVVEVDLDGLGLENAYLWRRTRARL